MTDSELVAKAAMAAGYLVIQEAIDGSVWCVPAVGDGHGFWWKPLGSDGDTGSGIVKAEEPHLDDVDAATRRAIVRAAAEMGPRNSALE